MINNKIELKDLVWKETSIEEKLDKLEVEWYKKWDIIDKDISKAKYYFDNSEQIAKEKAEILNKQIEYTKDDIIKMFVDAGFETNKDSIDFDMIYTLDIGKSDDYNIAICIYDYHIKFMYWCEDNDDALTTQFLKFNDRKRIEFYYNKIREILEFEVGNAV
jgi:hypothetical protein